MRERTKDDVIMYCVYEKKNLNQINKTDFPGDIFNKLVKREK